MSANDSAMQDSMNSCCKVLKEKYTKLEEKRNALRQAVKLLEHQIDKVQDENVNLKKACQEEQAQARNEKEGKELELAARVSLENQIATLNCEISSLQKKGDVNVHVTDEIALLRTRVSRGEKENNQLKELLENERKRADSEKKKAEVEKKAAEALKLENNKSDNKRNYASIEVEKAKECRLQLESLKKEVDEVKSKLAAETLKLQDANKKLATERQKAVTLKKYADSQISIAKDHHMLVETYKKKAEEEKCHAESFHEQLKENRRKVEDLQQQIQELVSSRKAGEAHVGQLDKETNVGALKRKDSLPKILQKEADESKLVLKFPKSELANKKLEIEKRRVTKNRNSKDTEMMAEEERTNTEQKFHPDQFSNQLEENKRKVEELQKKTDEFLLSRKFVEETASLNKVIGAKDAKMKFLRKQLKFEKMKTEHAKQVAEFEKHHNIVILQELGRLKMESLQFFHRLDGLSKSFRSGAEGIYELEKNEILKNMLKFKQSQQHSTPLLPLGGGIYAESISGIDSKLQPPLEGSNRKMLHSPAVNSSSASFSNGQLLGSQEKGAFSIPTSAKLVEGNMNAQPARSNWSREISKVKYNDNLAGPAENNVRSSLTVDVVGNVKYSKKRKRMLEVVDSIDYLYSEGKKLNLKMEEKLCQLHDMLNGKVGDPVVKQGNILSECRKSKKMKKTTCKDKITKQHIIEEAEIKKVPKVDTKGIEIPKGSKMDAQPITNFLQSSLACSKGLIDSVVQDLETIESFEELVDGDYMKLLQLDNAADEERYRRAMEMPLSPTLPEIQISVIETFDTECVRPLLEGDEPLLSYIKSQLDSRSFDVIDAEIYSNKMKFDGCGSSLVRTLYSGDCLCDSSHIRKSDANGVSDTTEVDNIFVCEVQNTDMEIEKINGSISGYEGVKSPFSKEVASLHPQIFEPFVVLSNSEDRGSISRIYSATRNCIAQCCLITENDWGVKKILLALKMEEKLLPKERACVLFSLLLVNFCSAAFRKFGSFVNWPSILCLNSFAEHIGSVMSNVETRSLFGELVCLDELLFLMEDFLLNGRVILYNDASSGTMINHGTKINIPLDGLDSIFLLVPASAYHLVAASIILASISSAINRIGILCNASYNMLRDRKCDSSLVLNVLHVFAYLGGEEYFGTKNCSLIITVLKSIVTYLEGMRLSCNTIFTPPLRDVKIEFSQCAKCPFSEHAVSIDNLIPILLQLLRRNLSIGKHGIMGESINSLHSGSVFEKYKSDLSSSLEGICFSSDINCDASCCLKKGKELAAEEDPVINPDLCHICDILSLVELLTCYMDWNWTCINIVPHLLKMLESCHMENFTAAIVILLGKLGRLGVETVGYEDNGIENLTSTLSAFLSSAAARRVGFPLQVAIVSSLLGLLSLNFEAVIQRVQTPEYESRSVPVRSISSWFSMLGQKQQDLSLSLFQTAVSNQR